MVDSSTRFPLPAKLGGLATTIADHPQVQAVLDD